MFGEAPPFCRSPFRGLFLLYQLVPGVLFANTPPFIFARSPSLVWKGHVLGARRSTSTPHISRQTIWDPSCWMAIQKIRGAVEHVCFGLLDAGKSLWSKGGHNRSCFFAVPGECHLPDARPRETYAPRRGSLTSPLVGWFFQSPVSRSLGLGRPPPKVSLLCVFVPFNGPRKHLPSSRFSI